MSSVSRADCPHTERSDLGVCLACGDCLHDVIVNGACYYCGETDLDGAALSPKPVTLVPADRLTKKV